jgi:hypothetical protein
MTEWFCLSIVHPSEPLHMDATSKDLPLQRSSADRSTEHASTSVCAQGSPVSPKLVSHSTPVSFVAEQ